MSPRCVHLIHTGSVEFTKTRTKPRENQKTECVWEKIAAVQFYIIHFSDKLWIRIGFRQDP